MLTEQSKPESFLLALLITGMVIGAFARGVGITWLLMHSQDAPTPRRRPSSASFGKPGTWSRTAFSATCPTCSRSPGAPSGARSPPWTIRTPPSWNPSPASGKGGPERPLWRHRRLCQQAEDGSIVLDPMPDLPAEQAGVQTGDVVIKVDDTEITPEMTVDDVVTLVRGEVGTIVRLTLRREGSRRADRRRDRAPGDPQPLAGVADAGRGARAWATCASCSLATAPPRSCRMPWTNCDDQGMTHLVLDLRGNGGGLLDAAIDVASEFLDDGVILYQVCEGEAERVETAKSGGSYTDRPTGRPGGRRHGQRLRDRGRRPPGPRAGDPHRPKDLRQRLGPVGVRPERRLLGTHHLGPVAHAQPPPDQRPGPDARPRGRSSPKRTAARGAIPSSNGPSSI